MFSLILTVALAGLVVFLITTYIPMAAPFKTVIYVIAAVCLILVLMQAFGIHDLPVPKVR